MPFVLPSKVTQENAVKLEQDGLAHEHDLQTVDCLKLKDFDSTVLTVLLSWQKALLQNDQKITIVNAPEKLKVLAGVYGVSALLGFV